jgi:hypothetical protein
MLVTAAVLEGTTLELFRTCRPSAINRGTILAPLRAAETRAA